MTAAQEAKAAAVHDARWRNARRTALLKEKAPAWWFARMMAAGRKAGCRVCGYDRRSRTTAACGWCGCETPDGGAG